MATGVHDSLALGFWGGYLSKRGTPRDPPFVCKTILLFTKIMLVPQAPLTLLIWIRWNCFGGPSPKILRTAHSTTHFPQQPQVNNKTILYTHGGPGGVPFLKGYPPQNPRGKVFWKSQPPNPADGPLDAPFSTGGRGRANNG
jgi:hypothetical protein